MPLNREQKDWSNLIVTVSTGIFAIISIISSYFTFTSWVSQREAARPYFTFKEPPRIDLNSLVQIELVLKNSGSNPATQLQSKLIVLKGDLTGEPLMINEHHLVNDFPKDSSGTLVVRLNEEPKITAYPSDQLTRYIVLYLNYTDPILNKKFSQSFFLKWPGSINRKSLPILHVEAEEKNKILKYLDSYAQNRQNKKS